jgi:hypothetical protein
VRQITIDLGEYVEEKKRRERRGGAVVAAVAIIAALVIVALPRTAPPLLAPTPAALTFSTQPVGTASPAQVVRLRNDGDGALSISSLTSTDDAFRLTHDCTAALAKGASCNATIVFAPPAPGPRHGELRMATNGGARVIALIGDAQAVKRTAVDLGPLDFGSVVIKTPRQPQRLRFVNSGAAPVTFSAPAISSPFVVTIDRCREVPPGGPCDVEVALPSDVVGSFTGQLRLIDTRGNLVAFSTLSGTTTEAIAPAHLAPTPAQITFPAQPIGSTWPAQVVPLRNDGDEPLSIKVSAKGDAFRVSNDCGKPLARTDSCSATVVFAPPAAGRYGGEVAIETNGGSATVGLGGEASAVPPADLSADFGRTFVGASVERVVTFVNRGPATIVIGRSTANAPFEVSADGCRNAKIAPGGNCAVRVQFRPAVSGAAIGELLLFGARGEIVAKGVLRGTGIGKKLTPAHLTASPTALAFPPQIAGTASAAQFVQLRNDGDEPLSIRITSKGDAFRVSNDCGKPLGRTGSCSAAVIFAPATAGKSSGIVAIVTNGGTATIKLDGEARVIKQPQPSIDIKPREINFLGDPGKKTVVVTNIGAVPVTLSAKPETVSRYLIDASQCNVTLAPGQHCTILIDGTVAVRIGSSTRIVISYAGRTEFVPVLANR